MYAAVTFFFIAINLMADRKESGWYFAMITGVVTFVAAFLAFVDRYNILSGQEWMRDAVLSLIFVVIIALPWFKKRISGKE